MTNSQQKYKCSRCNPRKGVVQFNSMEELKFHEQKDHVFSNKSSKAQKDILNQTYIEGHNAEGSTYTCKMCRQIFQRFSKFEWHSCDPNCIKTHQDTFSCKLCQKNFRRFGTYEGHPCRVKAKKDRDEEGYG